MSFSSVVVTAYLVHEVVCSDLRHGMRHGSRKHQVPTHIRIKSKKKNYKRKTQKIKTNQETFEKQVSASLKKLKKYVRF